MNTKRTPPNRVVFFWLSLPHLRQRTMFCRVALDALTEDGTWESEMLHDVTGSSPARRIDNFTLLWYYLFIMSIKWQERRRSYQTFLLYGR